MRLSAKALGITGALIWGGAVLVCGIANSASGSYASEFLKLLSSIYPGFHGSRTVGDVLVGTGYGLVDGGLGGLVFGWIYNSIARRLG
jgi:hypothetical protein